MAFASEGLHGKNITIPVRVVQGKLESSYGGPLPALKDGATGELVLPEYAVKQEEVVRWLQSEYLVDLLPAGASVLIAVDAERVPAKLCKSVVHPETRMNKRYTTFVPVTLDAPLKLLLRGDKHAVLRNCHCHFSAPELVEAESLNQAFTLISEVFEPGRTSRGGNVFRLGHYEDPEGCWRPLDSLRNSYQSQLEEYLRLVSLWIRLIPPEREDCGLAHQVALFADEREGYAQAEESEETLRIYLRGKGATIHEIVEKHRRALTRMVRGLDLDDQGRPCDKRLASALAWLVELCGGARPARERDVLSGMIELLVAVRSIPYRESGLVDRDHLLEAMEPILFDILEECRPEFAPPTPAAGRGEVKSE